MYYIWEFETIPDEEMFNHIDKAFKRNRSNSLCFYSPTMNRYTIQKQLKIKLLTILEKMRVV